MSAIFPEGGGDGSSYPRPNRFPLLVEQNDAMLVVTGQTFAHLPVANNEGIVDLAEVGDLDDVAKLCDFAVLGEFDAVGLVSAPHSLGVLAVVHVLELREEDDRSGGEEEVRGRGDGGGGSGGGREQTTQRHLLKRRCCRVCSGENRTKVSPTQQSRPRHDERTHKKATILLLAHHL